MEMRTYGEWTKGKFDQDTIWTFHVSCEAGTYKETLFGVARYVSKVGENSRLKSQKGFAMLTL